MIGSYSYENPVQNGRLYSKFDNAWYNLRPMKYHIWTEGCQMNVADSQRVGSSLEHLGYALTDTIEEADVIVLNTCVVRQSAEDKAMGRVTSLAPLKKKNPNLVINLMGCMVGVRSAEKLRARLPFVDVFSPPSDPGPLISHLTQGEIHSLENAETTRRFLMMDDELILPIAEQGKLISAHVPIVYGCSHACTFCIIPYKRGVERSRPVGDIVSEIRSIAKDIIVGFPGETEEQFMETYRVLSDLKLDVAHLARYSVREGTVATRRMEDNVPEEEKMRRLHMLDDLQEQIVDEINKKYLGQTVEVLFEDKVKERWRGRTPTNKLVFVESEEDLFGKTLPVTITWTGPWSMQAVLLGARSQKQPELISL